MISIKQINKKDIDLCYELDSNTISLWSKKQWANEFKKNDFAKFHPSGSLGNILSLKIML